MWQIWWETFIQVTFAVKQNELKFRIESRPFTLCRLQIGFTNGLTYASLTKQTAGCQTDVN
jgi:hypothetical protein